MCRVDYADCDGFWLQEPHLVRAAKAHRCDDCGREIARGENYSYSAWKEYGDRGIYTVKLCVHCLLAGRWLKVVCGGHMWPGVKEELEEHWDEESQLRTLGLGRLVICSRLHWQKPSGVRVTTDEVEAWVTDALAHTPEDAKRAA